MFTNDAKGPDCWKCSLNVEWHDCSFCPDIQLRRGIIQRNGTNTKPEPAPSIMPHPFRRKNLFKPMKMKPFNLRRSGGRKGFTLIELLTVIAIIAILAAMLLPVLSSVMKHAKITKARAEMSGLVQAIQGYDAAFGRFPASHNAQAAAAYNGANNNGNYDFTYGGTYNGFRIGTPVGGTILSNNEVIAILMDYTNYPGTANATINTNHMYNPTMNKLLNANLSGWDPSQGGQPLGGVDNSLTYRDPWGNPYVISMDLNYDDQCQDAFYSQKSVSWTGTAYAGYNGLNSPGFTGTKGGQDNFMFHGKVMVWSAGPDGKIDNSGGPSAKANQGVNKDNVLSWQ